MNCEALLADEPPIPLEADCCRCGRRTLAPVECANITGVTLYTCPDCWLFGGADGYGVMYA